MDVHTDKQLYGRMDETMKWMKGRVNFSCNALILDLLTEILPVLISGQIHQPLLSFEITALIHSFLG